MRWLRVGYIRFRWRRAGRRVGRKGVGGARRRRDSNCRRYGRRAWRVRLGKRPVAYMRRGSRCLGRTGWWEGRACVEVFRGRGIGGAGHIHRLDHYSSLHRGTIEAGYNIPQSVATLLCIVQERLLIYHSGAMDCHVQSCTAMKLQHPPQVAAFFFSTIKKNAKQFSANVSRQSLKKGKGKEENRHRPCFCFYTIFSRPLHPNKIISLDAESVELQKAENK